MVAYVGPGLSGKILRERRKLGEKAIDREEYYRKCLKGATGERPVGDHECDGRRCTTMLRKGRKARQKTT